MRCRFIWIARGYSLSRRLRHLEERWAYYFAFGAITIFSKLYGCVAHSQHSSKDCPPLRYACGAAHLPTLQYSLLSFQLYVNVQQPVFLFFFG